MADRRKRVKGPWSAEEIKVLRDMFPDGSFVQASDKLNRSLTAVRIKAAELGLRRRMERPWTQKELDYLKQVYPTTATWQIANKLDRPVAAVRRQAIQMGIDKKTRPGRW